MRIHPKVVRWIESFLCHRQQCVVLNGTASTNIPVKSGVPQGSVLGPLLFLVYINDLPCNIKSHVRLFADDCVLYRKICSEQDRRILQEDLNQLSSWCQDWQMNINIRKTKVMSFAPKGSHDFFQYHLDSCPLERVSSFKYLGVTISDDLSWNAHISNIISKSCSSLGFIRRTLRHASVAVKLLAYQTFVRSQLEYASIIWSPHQAYLINRIESVQNKAARFILSEFDRSTSVTCLKEQLGLCRLDIRRKIDSLCFFHKLYFQMPRLKNLYCHSATYISRTDHCFKVQEMHARTNKFQCSCLLMSIRYWNQLPHFIASEADPATFRALCERKYCAC